MRDKYKNFAALLAAEGDSAFSITAEDHQSAVVVVAPHGGGIEPGTSEIARAIARPGISLYTFDGQKADDNEDLHITSSNFDEPTCLALLASADAAVTVHGEHSSTECVYLGGRNGTIGARIEQSLRAKGFTVQRYNNPELQGLHPRNICNLGRQEAGVQLEISRGLRRSFFDSLSRSGRTRPTQRLQVFADAIREGLGGQTSSDTKVDVQGL